MPGMDPTWLHMKKFQAGQGEFFPSTLPSTFHPQSHIILLILPCPPFYELSSGNSVTCHLRLSPSSADVQRWAISFSNTPAQVTVEIKKRSI